MTGVGLSLSPPSVQCSPVGSRYAIKYLEVVYPEGSGEWNRLDYAVQLALIGFG